MEIFFDERRFFGDKSVMAKKAPLPKKTEKSSKSNAAPHPHDRCFRKVMGKSKIALKFLRSSMPAHIMDQIDPKSLQLVDGTFIDAAHCETRTDILYRANLKVKNKGKISALYFLLEHQRTMPALMPMRIHRYMLSIIERHWQENHGQWTTVYTAVLYNGKKNHSVEPNFFKNFEYPLMAKESFDSYYLVDLNKIDDELLKQHEALGLLELVFKHSGTKKTIEFISSIGDVISKAQSTDLDIVGACSLYLFETNKDGASRQQILEEIQKYLTPKNRKIIMTIAQAFKEDGRQEGRQEGQATFLSDLLKDRFHRAFTAKYLKMINAADSDTLSTWGKKLFNAKSIDDVFSGTQQLHG